MLGKVLQGPMGQIERQTDRQTEYAIASVAWVPSAFAFVTLVRVS